MSGLSYAHIGKVDHNCTFCGIGELAVMSELARVHIDGS